MTKNKDIELQNGALTNPMATNSQEFKDVRAFLDKHIASLSKDRKINIELVSLKIKIEDYLNANDGDMITVGDFIRLYLERLNIKQNVLAKYIGMQPSNFSKILSGSRKVNFELSFILSHIFSLDPRTWMMIQVKNDYLRLKNEKAKDYQHFKLEELQRLHQST